MNTRYLLSDFDFDCIVHVDSKQFYYCSYNIVIQHRYDCIKKMNSSFPHRSHVFAMLHNCLSCTCNYKRIFVTIIISLVIYHRCYHNRLYLWRGRGNIMSLPPTSSVNIAQLIISCMYPSPGTHDTFTQCCPKVGPSSPTCSSRKGGIFSNWGVDSWNIAFSCRKGGFFREGGVDSRYVA